MKWEVTYAIEKASGKTKKAKETIEAKSIREAAMQAHSVIVRPLKSQKENKGVVILSLKAMEPA